MVTKLVPNAFSHFTITVKYLWNVQLETCLMISHGVPLKMVGQMERNGAIAFYHAPARQVNTFYIKIHTFFNK